MKKIILLVIIMIVLVGSIAFFLVRAKELMEEQEVTVKRVIEAPTKIIEIPKQVTKPEPEPVQETITLTDHNTSNGWSLLWHEEFIDSKIDDLKWQAVDDDNGWGNRSQHYLPNNLKIVDNALSIQARKETIGNFNYTSGAIITQDKFEFQYGKLEVRVKFPKGKGFIPAVWMLPVSGKQYPEIDIAEMIGQKPTQLWNVVHDLNDNGKPIREFHMTEVKDMTTDFHTYGIEWSATEIKYLFDGEVIFTGTKLVPQEKMYLYMNVGVGGSWVGEPNASTPFPSEMLIDYVRYYN